MSQPMSKPPVDRELVSESIRQTLQDEADAILSILAYQDDNPQPHCAAVELLLGCTGRVVVTGMGKMGAIARKCAATFSSTGTPAIFMHPAEAMHGDLGIVTSGDVLLVLSYSGQTDEVNKIIPYMRRHGIPVIAVTGNVDSPLAQHAQVILNVQVAKEADPIALAPTCSTTVSLAVCDALAVALMRIRGFTREQFAIYHPGGSLGRKLLLTVADLMITGDNLPIVGPSTALRDAILEISRKKLGAVFITDKDARLLGILTDGDLRRTLRNSSNPLQDPIERLMTQNPSAIHDDALAAEALRVMETKSITILPVVAETKLIGAIHIHHLIQAGLA
ncbi:MAG TPA: KpsF/GutQ family sugar-phosphate isomerase [Pirellulaceae bacterium]|nr:KpsF/GutQ family sugar-phosphate isomerase [Pirellulaceae bacterium]